MPVTEIIKDPTNLTLTIVADFSVSAQRLWDVYVDPRQIERFWGPPTYPATFGRHDAHPGGRSSYYMTGPDGDRTWGYWEWIAVDAPHSFEVVDGFADADGQPNAEMPTMRMVFTFASTDDGSRLTTTSYFNSLEELEKLIEMGMVEGTREAMSQIDAVLADLASFAAGLATETQILNDTQVRISRVIRGPIELVWSAHHDPDLLKQWLLGPDGWTMPVCEVAANVGDTYRYLWEPEAGGQGEGFGFTGELVESAAPYREVTTEAMIGMETAATLNELTLTPVPEGTLLSLVITYPDTELRDTVLATGMTDGMETSYQRLERLVAAAP